MITIEDIVGVTIKPAGIKLCKKYAEKLASIDHFETNRQSTKDFLCNVEEQLTGQLGEASLFTLLFGTVTGYIETQEAKEVKKGFKGDRGQDIPGYRVDIKTSLARNPNKSFLDYNLIVEPRHLHKNWCYISALIPYPLSETKELKVSILGWSMSESLSLTTTKAFGTKYTLSCGDLNPMTAFNLEEFKINVTP
jgi:hypothetical protein